MVVEGVRARGGHGVSLQARPPCGERGIRLRLIQRLFKYHKWSAVTSKIATRPVCVLLPDIVGDGRVESGSGVLLVALCATPSGGRLFCPSIWPLNGHDGVVFGTCDWQELLPRTQVWVRCTHQRRQVRSCEVLNLKQCFGSSFAACACVQTQVVSLGIISADV